MLRLLDVTCQHNCPYQILCSLETALSVRFNNKDFIKILQILYLAAVLIISKLRTQDWLIYSYTPVMCCCFESTAFTIETFILKVNQNKTKKYNNLKFRFIFFPNGIYLVV